MEKGSPDKGLCFYTAFVHCFMVYATKNLYHIGAQKSPAKWRDNPIVYVENQPQNSTLN